MDIKRLRVGTKVKMLEGNSYVDKDQTAQICRIPDEGNPDYWVTPYKYNEAAADLFRWMKSKEEEEGKNLGKVCIGNVPTRFKVLKY